MSAIQHAAARKLLPILHEVVDKHRPPLTYTTAANEIGRTKGSARMVAQVCDLLDVAALLAGVPLLALVAVRQADGEVNRMAWRQVPLQREKIIRESLGHAFTDADIQAIGTALDRLNGKSNREAWKYLRTVRPEGRQTATTANSENGKTTLRNPAWNRDELIVTLEFYFRHEGNPPAKDSDEIRDLSLFLNRMSARLADVGKDFRNPSGVYMKLMNFRRFDPVFASQGKVGLQRGGKTEEAVWTYYSAHREELNETATAIRENVESGELVDLIHDDRDEEEAEEGNLLSRVHKFRERNRKLVHAKKVQVLKEKGSLACEVCSFDFSAKYGKRGDGFIEVHHTKPLHTLKPGTKTKLEELALLCANCHRMVHARRPWLGLAALRELLSEISPSLIRVV